MATPLDTNIIIRYVVDDPAVSDLAAGAYEDNTESKRAPSPALLTFALPPYGRW